MNDNVKNRLQKVNINRKLLKKDSETITWETTKNRSYEERLLRSTGQLVKDAQTVQLQGFFRIIFHTPA